MEKTLLFFTFFLFMKGLFGETHKIVSVEEGDSVILRTGLTEIQKDDVMDWTFKAEVKAVLIARVEYNSKPITYDDLNETFRGRLMLNGQTGDLTITKTRTTDSGVYEVFNSFNTIRETFYVSVNSPGQSPGRSPSETAGIVVGAVVSLVAAAAATAAGVFCYKKKRQVL